MLANRSIPRCREIPELAYPDISQVVDWLCDAFGFTLRVRIANHRTPLNVGDGAMVVTELGSGAQDEALAVMAHIEKCERPLRTCQATRSENPARAY
jgi:hypothetical protein